ncbi:MAG: 3-keto-5-aminohexanoate cleavage protein [Granulosicoccus sp.]
MGIPKLMVAPNGARLQVTDHPSLPLTIPDILSCARDCYSAGAGAIHAHVRNENGDHVLDSGLFRELLSEFSHAIPGMLLQISTECVGQYKPEDQRRLVREVQPRFVSVALREQNPHGKTEKAQEFYTWMDENGIEVQHILYSKEDLLWCQRLLEDGYIQNNEPEVLFVLGRHLKEKFCSPADLDEFLSVLEPDFGIQWAVCAFGSTETRCLNYAHKKGGKLRVGFENNLFNDDGQIALDNADRVREIIRHSCL